MSEQSAKFDSADSFLHEVAAHYAVNDDFRALMVERVRQIFAEFSGEMRHKLLEIVETTLQRQEDMDREKVEAAQALRFLRDHFAAS
jgi:hypothetical protein